MTQATSKPKLFLDSSAFISAVISSQEGSAIRRVVALGEAGVLDLRISREVVSDTERLIRSRNASMLPLMAQVIAQGRLATTLDPNEDTISFCDKLIGYRPDARILAAAVEADVDILVTLDTTHLLGNPNIAPPTVNLLVMRPHDALNWCYDYWLASRNA